MSFILKGNLAGELCSDCKESLVGSIIRFYRVEDLEIGLANVAANPKLTLAVLTEEAVSAKSKLLMAETKIDENGNYEVALDDSYQNYGGPLMIDVLTKSVPNQKEKDKEPVQFTITTVQPKWKEFENDFIFEWRYCLPQRFWCFIRGLFDAWVICGRLLSCEDQETPISGVIVTAFDADWITDDELGSANTDSNGYFRIDYTSRDFKQTFLSPLINIETPFPPFNSGPDVYFKVETSGGAIIYEETRSDGEQGGRSNIGPCFCITICVPFEVPPIPVASAWTGIGNAFTIPIGASLNDFDASGYAGGLKYAITGSPRMTGQVALTTTNKVLQGNPIEYRFRVSDTTGVNGAPAIAESNFTKIVGAGPDKDLFAKTKIGEMIYFGTPFNHVEIFAELEDLDDQGWLDVGTSVVRTFTDEIGLDPNDLTDPTESEKWHFIDTDGLMAINTSKLTDNTMPTVSDPGIPVPVGDRKDIEKIAIRFEVREVINKATNSFNYLPASGQTLNAMIVNNTAALMPFNIVELVSNACDTLSGNVNVTYTVHHPHLEDVSINVRSNSNTINTNLTGTNLSLINNTNDIGLNHLNDGSLSITSAPNNISLITCAYIATLSVKRRLHTGDSGISPKHDQKAFYYNA
ncbi:hypothetical protein [Aquimarina sp. 2201CG5-10]|uniref:hypothetical protein n=1 Tax=Aquimarina callyspongiae TaxID=3098150 RepID=UPI002AB59CEB|nr:hypothetical protein [Aquimarina sp. 2201CG5-10]MDY8136600.1 hypothetical protein [Aquimarina sp. 2201CG5-10]